MPPVTAAEAEGSDLRCTAFLMPAVALLRRAGLWERLEPHAAPLRVMRIADAGGAEPVIRETADFAAREIGAGGLRLQPAELAAAARDGGAARGAAARRGCAPARVEQVTPRTDEALARLADGTQVRAAAGGRRGRARQRRARGARASAARRWSYGQKALVFTVAHALPHDGVSTEIHRSGGPFTLVPLPDRDGAHALGGGLDGGGAARGRALAAMDADAFEAELNARACGVLGALRLPSPRRLWPIVAQVADRLDGPRTALVAEAAHVVPPIGAQGLNMSLRRHRDAARSLRRGARGGRATSARRSCSAATTGRGIPRSWRASLGSTR